MTRIAAASPDSTSALLGSASQKLDVGLMGARTAAVLRRIVGGLAMEDVDKKILDTTTDILRSTAEAVETVAKGGTLRRHSRSVGFSAMAFTVEHAAPSASSGDLPAVLRRIASELDSLEGSADPDLARALLPAFSAMAEAGTQQAGTVGEGNSSLL